uniref:Uncharacterized protein eiAUOrf40 n=2 Tax=Viruses TaxID=10239 RepID=E7EKS9_9CAUD|nr:unknown [Edwardsiella phage eiAU]ADV36538.1 unknown [Edwardsiella phage eiMSLS]
MALYSHYGAFSYGLMAESIISVLGAPGGRYGRNRGVGGAYRDPHLPAARMFPPRRCGYRVLPQRAGWPLSGTD